MQGSGLLGRNAPLARPEQLQRVVAHLLEHLAPLQRFLNHRLDLATVEILDRPAAGADDMMMVARSVDELVVGVAVAEVYGADDAGFGEGVEISVGGGVGDVSVLGYLENFRNPGWGATMRW